MVSQGSWLNLNHCGCCWWSEGFLGYLILEHWHQKMVNFCDHFDVQLPQNKPCISPRKVFFLKIAFYPFRQMILWIFYLHYFFYFCWNLMLSTRYQLLSFPAGRLFLNHLYSVVQKPSCCSAVTPNPLQEDQTLCSSSCWCEFHQVHQKEGRLLQS